MIIRIAAKHFTAGAVIEQGCVSRSAPIIKYMMAWTAADVKAYCKKKGWHWEVLV